MKTNILWLLSACILLTACQKRKYPDESVQLEQQAIYFNGYIDNEALSLKIGDDGYYCYSSYKQRADSIYMFEGTLKKVDCNPCPLSLQVQLFDFRQRAPGSVIPPDSSFRSGSRGFVPGMSIPNTIRFVSLSNKEVSSLKWDLSNGVSSQDSILNYEFGQPGPQTVSLTVRTKGNCESMVVNRIFIGGESGLFASSITANLIQNNNSQFSAAIIGGKAPFRYTWNFGDGITSQLPAPSHNYQWAGSYPVKLRVEDAENHMCESNYIHIAGNDMSSCTANMLLFHTGSRRAFLNGVKIQWTDRGNTALRSDSIAQPAASYFEIINSQAFKPNERGEAGRLLTLRFNVLLSDGSRKVWCKSENTAIAVTYK